MSRFTDKVVWITGASSGIGEALVHAFAVEGAKLVISARRKEELERVQIASGLNHQNSLILPLDLSDTKNINDLTQQIINKFGRIDILVNNGGISQRALTKDTSLDIDRQIMEVNFFGTVAITKSVLPYMLKQKSGHIIAMSSIAGKFGFYFRSAYSASKHALHGFFESLRMEIYNDNVKVLVVCPGKIKTNISVNAVTGSGGKHAIMDQSTNEGLSAEECAKQILKAIKANEEEIFIGGKELKAIWIKRFFPKLFSKMIRRQKPE
ncbi:MAG: short-chain dehydrogenase/reductase [Bacteroidetes bacterium]|jgi:short-subunit dehydrogenase|nr:short-chain dehydrogenase/reductase [Bacteroidota bacterium]